MTIKTASPQDTQDHMLGSGALSFSWWQNCTVRYEDTPAWEADLTCEDGDGGSKTVTIDHKDVLTAARNVMSALPKYGSDELARQCRNLIFDADEADFDACSADELLQVLVLGEVVFG